MKIFDMMTSEDIERIKKETDLTERVKQLNNSLSIALEINDKYQRENKDLKDRIKESGEINKLHQELNEKLKKRAQEAEGELTIIKGIGNTSPEMKSLRLEVAALKQQLHTDRNEYQKNLDRIKKENNELYNKLAKLIDPAEKIQKARESGL